MTLDTTLHLKKFHYAKLMVAFFASCVIAALLAWSVYNYQPDIVYGSRAIFSFVILSMTLALLGRYLLLRIIKKEASVTRVLYHQLPQSWQTLFLFDITAPIYLAAGVLVGVPAAVLTALVTQTALQIFTYRRHFVSLVEALYRIASTALVVLIVDELFVIIGDIKYNQVTKVESAFVNPKELIGTIIAAVALLLLLTIASLLTIVASRGPAIDSASPPGATRKTILAFLRSRVLGYQALVLSVGPLLAVVDILDNGLAEIAWLFFLVPLFAIYYLALVSTRLNIRTDTLQETLTDLNSARRRQNELRDYASLITRVQEEERRRLARELHDDTAQALIALALGLDGLGRAIGKLDLAEKDRKWLASLQDLAAHTLEGVRRACRDLRPSLLDDLGLRAALEWLSDSSNERGVDCSFTCRGVPQPTTSEREIAIFRIAQEALSNIWRHSKATQASVEVEYGPGSLRLSIHDNGMGFVLRTKLDTTPNPQGGLGLVGIRERAALIGATLKIKSSPGEGCHIELALPIALPALTGEPSTTM